MIGDVDALCRQIVDQSVDCIKVLDHEANVLWINDAGRKLMDVCDLSSMIGSRWLDFWTGEARAGAESAIAEAIEHRTGRFTGPCTTMAGALKWWSVVVTRLAHSPGDIRLIVVSRDISEIVNLVEAQKATADAERIARVEAERAAQFREAFLYSVSHDLSVPLNAILGWSGMLAEDATAPSVLKAAEAIQSAAAQQMRLVGQLAEAARLASVPSFQATAVTLSDVVDETIRVLQPMFDAKRLDLWVEGRESQAVVSGDVDQLLRATYNLVGNAIKFTPQGGWIRIVLTNDRVSATLLVSDSGCGLRAEWIPHIFKRFWKPDRPDAPPGGLGLGLAMVQSIVTLHGGTLEATSDGPGLGAQFVVSLPLRSSAIHHPTESRTSVPAGPGQIALAGMRVLLLLPDLAQSDILSNVLRHFGAAAVPVGSVTAALGLESHDFTCVLIDENVPQRDIAAVLRKCRTAACREVPALVLVSGDSPLTAADGLCVRMRKPVSGRGLVAAIQQLVGAQQPEGVRRA